MPKAVKKENKKAIKKEVKKPNKKDVKKEVKKPQNKVEVINWKGLPILIQCPQKIWW